MIKFARSPCLALSNRNNNHPPIVGMLRLCERTHAKFLAYSGFPTVLSSFRFFLPNQNLFNAYLDDGYSARHRRLLSSTPQIQFPAFSTYSWHGRVTFMDSLHEFFLSLSFSFLPFTRDSVIRDLFNFIH